MDLLAYRHVPLANKAFELIFKHFNRREQLISLLKQIQLLEHSESIQTLKRVGEVMVSLKQFVERISHLLRGEEIPQPLLVDLAVRLLACKDNLDYLSQILVQNNVEQSYSIQINRDSEPSAYDWIPGLPKSAQLFVGSDRGIRTKSESYADNFIPNTENQRLLRNLGVLDVILDIVRANAERPKANTDFTEVIASAYLFLVRF